MRFKHEFRGENGILKIYVRYKQTKTAEIESAKLLASTINIFSLSVGEFMKKCDITKFTIGRRNPTAKSVSTSL